MLSNLNKRFFNVFVFAFLCLIFPLSCFSESFISSEKVDDIYKKFAEIDCFKEYFKKNNIREELSFEAKDKLGNVRKGRLIPLYDCKEFRESFISTRAKGHADAEHMRFFMSGNLSSEQDAISLFERRIKRMWTNPPKSLYFGIAIENAKGYSIVGDTLVSSLMGGDDGDSVVECVLSKDASGIGIGSAAASCLMQLVEKLVKNVKAYSNLKCVKATAKVGNGASNRILEKLGFELIKRRPCRANEQLMEYYYEYTIKHWI